MTQQKPHKIRSPLFYGMGFLILLILAEFLAIIILNNGMLVYTLDDPYIHMALAENIIRGHYGVNANEYSAPSSSILWPIILAPFSSDEYFPLLINIASAFATIYIFHKVLTVSFTTPQRHDQRLHILISSLLVLLILATNIVGLIYNGMEHSLQALLCTIIAYGLIIEVERGRVAPWLFVAIVAAPLIRYEDLAISVSALIYLGLRGYLRHTVSGVILVAASLGGFSLFLKSLGLGPFPTSVVAKSSVVATAGRLASVLGNVEHSLNNPHGVVLAIGALALLAFCLFTDDSKKRLLAFVTILAVTMQLLAGHFGTQRYEIYIWTFLLLVSLYLYGTHIQAILEIPAHGKGSLAELLALAIAFAIASSSAYIYDIIVLPIASNNIYEQQYQMHRFAVYYNKPVAVNDLGYVSYKNDNYVLDLWGLASEPVLNFRERASNDNWMNALCRKYDVQLAMIYEPWFKNIPTNWIKLGDLHLGKPKISPADDDVAFYATTPNAYADTLTAIDNFAKTLPHDVNFTFQKENL